MDHRSNYPDRPGRRTRILFFAESVTLAHVSRPIALAQCLSSDRYEVTFAMAPRYREFWEGLPFEVRPIQSIPTEQFLDALVTGRPLYDVETLQSYIRDDLEVIRQVHPDVIIGDFRLSLSVSARLEHVPYLAIINGYWSPFARQRFPMPELRPFTHLLPLPISLPLFHFLRPFAFAIHAMPLNRLRKEHGLSSLGLDLRRIYTDADHVLYADLPEIAPTVALPPNHHYLGPILWSPRIPLPEWWTDVPEDRPIIYVNLGSSGPRALLPMILDALSDRPVTVLAAAARDFHRLDSIPRNAWVAPYLPGQEAAARARLVICNGGSPSTYQALAVGSPILGLASNMDQHLNMSSVRRLGAGLLLRADRVTPACIQTTIDCILSEKRYRHAAGSIRDKMASMDLGSKVNAIIESVLTFCVNKACN